MFVECMIVVGIGIELVEEVGVLMVCFYCESVWYVDFNVYNILIVLVGLYLIDFDCGCFCVLVDGW